MPTIGRIIWDSGRFIGKSLPADAATCKSGDAPRPHHELPVLLPMIAADEPQPREHEEEDAAAPRGDSDTRRE